MPGSYSPGGEVTVMRRMATAMAIVGWIGAAYGSALAETPTKAPGTAPRTAVLEVTGMH